MRPFVLRPAFGLHYAGKSKLFRGLDGNHAFIKVSGLQSVSLMAASFVPKLSTAHGGFKCVQAAIPENIHVLQNLALLHSCHHVHMADRNAVYRSVYGQTDFSTFPNLLPGQTYTRTSGTMFLAESTEGTCHAMSSHHCNHTYELRFSVIR